MRATISFEEDARLVNKLLDLLTIEQKALVQGNVDEIEQLIDSKAAVLQEINIVAKNRYAALAERKYDANENGMLAWVVGQSNQAIKDSWDDFQAILAKAKEMNRLNGDLINRHFNRNKQMLNDLRNAVQPNNNVYGKNGQPSATQRKQNVQTA